MLHTIWELLGTFRAEHAHIKSENAVAVSTANSIVLREMRMQIDTLVLANQAMWELLSERNGLTESQLLKKMQEVDVRDGKEDGRIVKKVLQECPDCQRKIAKARLNCYWCGAKVTIGSPFSPN